MSDIHLRMEKNVRKGLTLALTFSFVLANPTWAAKPKKAEAAPKEAAPLVNDFPTQARVEYVMQCMAEHGGSNLDNMYHCVCAIDKIAGTMNFQDYSEALTFTYMFDTPGDKGGEFRDPPKSKVLRDQLKMAKKSAESCFPQIPATAPTAK